MGRHAVLSAGFILALTGPLFAQAPVRLIGRVTPDATSPVAGASITVKPAEGTEFFHANSDPTGAFVIQLPKPGVYSVRVNREGFYIHTEPALSVPFLSGGNPAE